jgi:hypothetical protein
MSMRVEDLLADDPAEAARRFAAVIARSNGTHASQVWVGRFVGELDRMAEREELDRVLDTWGITNAEAGRLFGVTRQAIGKWRANGLPDERRAAVGDLAAVTDLLVHYLKRERVPAVVRRPADRLGGCSMVDLVSEGRTGELLEFTRSMFDLRRLDAA